MTYEDKDEDKDCIDKQEFEDRRVEDVIRDILYLGDDTRIKREELHITWKGPWLTIYHPVLYIGYNTDWAIWTWNYETYEEREKLVDFLDIDLDEEFF